jgi:outer membrane protein OmpA-like peptidoglycan-associated protein
MLITREIAPAPAEESKAESKPAAAASAPTAPQQTAAKPDAPAETPKVPTAPAAAAAPPTPAPTVPPVAGGAKDSNGAASRPSGNPPAQTAAANIAIPVAAPASIPGRISAVRFEAGVSEIPASAQPTLDAIAARLIANDTTHLQLVAYASGTGDDPIEARRISLARAVAVRAYLIEKGVHSFRMDVRALGNRNEDNGPADRVDLILLDH